MCNVVTMSNPSISTVIAIHHSDPTKVLIQSAVHRPEFPIHMIIVNCNAKPNKKTLGPGFKF